MSLFRSFSKFAVVRLPQRHVLRAMFVVVLALSLALAGCHPPANTAAAHNPSQPPTLGPVDLDPCARQMQDIGGALLMYYALKRQLPQNLTEAQTYADEPLVPVCPVSHQPFIYNPAGLEGPNDQRKLILYDASPVHNGARHGIVWGRDLAGGNPTIDVVTVPEALFRLYHQAIPKSMPTIPPRSPAGRGQ